jgi:hypothetical protein
VTVAELIEKLQQFPPEMEVVRGDYENGWDELTPAQVTWYDTISRYFDRQRVGERVIRIGDG